MQTNFYRRRVIMEIFGLRCVHCKAQLFDEDFSCKECAAKYTHIQAIIAREHYDARIKLLNAFLKTRKRPSVSDEWTLKAISIELMYMVKFKVKLNEKLITDIFRNHETRAYTA